MLTPDPTTHAYPEFSGYPIAVASIS